MRKDSLKGLTLMELLIVIAIIAALASLLFPVFQSVRKAGYMTVCRSNLRQIYQALKLYEEDYGEFFYRPPGRDRLLSISRSEPYPVECDLASALYPYTKDTSIFVCLVYPRPGGFCKDYFGPDLPPMSYPYNYAFARWKGHPITSNLVCLLCTMHGEWCEERMGDIIWLYKSPTLVCLMDGSIHLYHPRIPEDRPFTYP